MIRTASLPGLALAALLAFSASVEAQQQPVNLAVPRLNTIFPPGAKVGSTVEITFAGTDLEEPEKLVFNHPGLKAEPVQPAAPADPKQPKPAITKFKVTVAPNTPVGNHDVRLVNKWGISNARAFVVGDLSEANETEPNNDVPQAQKVALNTTVNGSMANPTDVDYSVFAAKKGQRVVVACLASSIDSRLTPGVEVYDANRKLVASSKQYAGTDAVCDFTAPDDGEYQVRVYEFTHTAGDANYFYRLSITTGPWIDAVHPPCVEPGKTTQVTVYGRNLPGGQLDPTAVSDDATLEKLTMTVNPPADPPAVVGLNYGGHVGPSASGLDGYELRVKNSVGSSNAFLLTYAKAPVVLEASNSRTADTAQEVTVPCEVGGRIDRRSERDWYSFNARKDDVLSLELIADRIGGQGDMYFVLRNATNKQNIVEQDDNTDILSNKFWAKTDDPAAYRFVVPADGKYQVMVGSRTASVQSGPRCYYRLRVSRELPDFRLVAVGPDGRRPTTCALRQGGNDLFSVFAWRQDGFNGDIALTVEGLPKGVTCLPQKLGGTTRHAQLVLSAAADAADWTGDIRIKGTATINGKPVVREARAGSIVWQVQQDNIPTFGRIERGLPLAVRAEKAPYTLTAELDKNEALHGDKVTLTVKVNRLSPDVKQPIVVQIYEQFQQNRANALPQNLQIQPANIAAGQNEVKITITPNTNVLPGAYNLVLRGQTQIPYNKDPKATNKPNVQVAFPTTPVTLTILPKTLANLSVQNVPGNVKAGATAKVQVQVQRQSSFDGEFKVEFVLPQGVTGVTAAPVVIAPGQNSAELTLAVDANAAPGARQNLTVKATAMFLGKPVVHESKFNLNVTK